MTVRGATVGREIEDKNEDSFHELVESDLNDRFSVEYYETAEEPLTNHRTST